MNPTPRLSWNGHKGLITNPGCGRVAMENVARSFWQSRAMLRDPPELVDLRKLAAELRHVCPLR